MAWTPKRIALLLIDSLLLCACWIMAYNLRFAETGIPQSATLNGDDYLLQMKLLVAPVVIVHVVLFWSLSLYRGMWRYSGTTELRSLAIAAVLWSLGFLGFNAFLYNQAEFFDLPQRFLKDGATEVIPIPFSILGLYVMMGTLATGGLRMVPRLIQEVANRNEAVEAPATMIVGAGDLADGVVRNIRRAGSLEYRLVCAVAQVPSRVGMRLHGVPVVGTIDKIPDVLRENKIERVLIAMDDQSPAELRRVVLFCEAQEISFRIVPSLKDLESGRVEVSNVRAIEVEDLLGREPVQRDLAEDRNYVRGQVVMITGAGGSIGSELTRQCAAAGAVKLILVGKGENSIFEIEAEIRRAYPSLNVVALIADVRETERVEHIFREHKPAIVFHAAAHKHVPLMETAPDEAIKNNILGTANVAIMADRHGAERFVLISTDKAVRPTSVMGATKRMAEMIVFAISANSRCCFQAVRFGNVLGSRGSVIPTFRRQIAAGGPVTVTHPDVTRYFMTIPEAVSLVLRAGSRKRNGALYLLDMGEPVRIADLARNMISLSGLRPGVDIAIEYIGLRPGEKLREELLTEAEGAEKTELDKIFETKPRNVLGLDELLAQLDRCRDLAERGNAPAIRGWLRQVVPDYHPSEETSEFEQTVSEEVAVMTANTPPLLAPEELEPEPEPVPPTKSVGEQTDLLDMPEEDPLAALEAAVAQPADPVDAPPEESALGPLSEEFPRGWSDEPLVPSTADEAVEETAVFSPLSEEVPTSWIDESGDAVPAPVEPLKEADGLVELDEKPVASIEQTSAICHSTENIADETPTPLAPAVHAAEVPPLSFDASSGSADVFVTTPVEGADIEIDAGQQGEETLLSATQEEAWSDMARTPIVIALRVAKSVDTQTLGQLVQVLGTGIGPDDKIVCIGEAASLAGLPAGVASVARDGKTEGAAFAEAVALAPKAGILLTTSAEVIFEANALDLFAAALSGAGAVAYADYREDRDGATSDVKLHDHEGCPHERFEFGPVIAYRLADVAKVGGIRKDLNYAWEYDLHLKLMELAEFAHIKQVAYTRFVPVVVDDKGKKVFSPGMGPLGGFSYVFYPADVEKEVTSVWEEALKRRGAWIDHPAVPVNHEGRDYPLLASIVIPILNRVKYIGNAIEKVQKGTFQNFEMVIVDNGSTDGTIEAVQAIAAADPRIRLLHGKGGSIASALNEGIKAARGKYICQLDSDDEYAPDCLEQMIGHLESHPNCGLAISYYRLMDENGVIIDDVAPITHSGYSRNQILRRDGGGAVRIFPKAVLEEFGYYDEVHYGNFGEDYDMVLKTGEKYDVDRVHKVLYHYRRHSDNTDVTRDPAMKYKNKNRARQEALRRRKEINKKLGKA